MTLPSLGCLFFSLLPSLLAAAAFAGVLVWGIYAFLGLCIRDD